MAQRWLDTGVYYTEHQLTGPYVIQTQVDNLYPPHALYLFVPFLFLPAILWWVIPLGVIGYVVWWCRPVAWMWPILALIVLFPKTPGQILFGNTDMWIAAAIAGGVRWAWPSVFMTLKPSLGLLRLDRHPVAVVVDRRRPAGARQPAVPVAVARLPDRHEELERHLLVLVRKSAVLRPSDRRVSSARADAAKPRS